MSFFFSTVSGYKTREVDLPSWQRVSDHLTDKFESNKNTPGLEEDQSQPDRIMWTAPAYSSKHSKHYCGNLNGPPLEHWNIWTTPQTILPGLEALKSNFCLLKQTLLASWEMNLGNTGETLESLKWYFLCVQLLYSWPDLHDD